MVLDRIPDAAVAGGALAVGVGGAVLAVQYGQPSAAVLGFVPFLAFVVIRAVDD
jgi:hypothetical protein